MKLNLNLLFLSLLAVTVAVSQASAFPKNSSSKRSGAPIQLTQKEQDILKYEMHTDYNFDGIVGLDNCSGALVKFEGMSPNAKALMLTNGHCVDTGNGEFIKPNQFLYNQPNRRGVKFLKPDGTSGFFSSTKTTKLIYATMTGTDVGLYELELTYAEIEKKFNSHALTLSADHASLNEGIEILSGFWKKGYECSVDKFVYQLREDAYSTSDSIRYSQDGCHIIHGTSGSPIISKVTRKIVGINNTGNDDGKKCTMNNPCEVSAEGEITFQKGLSYGQQVNLFYSCLNSNMEVDLQVPGCKLFH